MSTHYLNDFVHCSLGTTPPTERGILVPSDGSAPSPRASHTAVIGGEDDERGMYIFGGCLGIGDPSQQASNQLFRYLFDSSTWEIVPSIGAAPPRYDHTAVVVQNRMWIFGGCAGSLFHSDLFYFSFSSQSWFKVRSQGLDPMARSRHAVIPCHDSGFIIWGGSQNSNFLNDAHLYDADVNEWKQIQQKNVPSARRDHAMAITKNGKIYMYGGKESGNYAAPILYTSDLPAENSQKIRVNSAYEIGSVYCFGFGGHGQLGTGSMENRNSPSSALNLLGRPILKIAAGGGHTCAFDSSGMVYEWGGASSYTKIEMSVPRLVSGLKEKRVTMISCGALHTMAVTEDQSGDPSEVYVWGDNQSNKSPRLMKNLAGKKIFEISSTALSCFVITNDLIIYSWNLSQENNLTIVDVEHKIHKMACGGNHVLFLGDRGKLYSYGKDCESGQLGLSTVKSVNEIVQVEIPGYVVAMACGNDHSIVVTSEGKVYTFGDNKHGQLGLGDEISRNVPTILPFNLKVSKAAAGGGLNCAHSVLITENGDVYSFGSNKYGQLGFQVENQVENVNVPTKVPTLTDVIHVACGWVHTAVLVKSSRQFVARPPLLGTWDLLPHNILAIEILPKLDAVTLGRLYRVNSVLKKLSSADKLWKAIMQKEFPHDVVPSGNYTRQEYVKRVNRFKIPKSAKNSGFLSRMQRGVFRFSKKEYRLLMVGLDAAGRTTLLYKMKLGETVTTIPTIGFNVETVEISDANLTIWDV
eukprot:TRINITY_DN3741_c1_g1_i1.p1 TRINITY_DN3741_c1_g1~~TRINITY_DN3741_c1_g1_i1.p1  ORF type:complete len:837 (-),score=233.99 TRINITY_DN3741_c1_g1_i1:384-2633(-)